MGGVRDSVERIVWRDGIPTGVYYSDGFSFEIPLCYVICREQNITLPTFASGKTQKLFQKQVRMSWSSKVNYLAQYGGKDPGLSQVLVSGSLVLSVALRGKGKGTT